jgi:hypothetical protein
MSPARQKSAELILGMGEGIAPGPRLEDRIAQAIDTFRALSDGM